MQVASSEERERQSTGGGHERRVIGVREPVDRVLQAREQFVMSAGHHQGVGQPD